MIHNLRDLARALGGRVVGCHIIAPGPGHSVRDRSLSVRLSATAPDGFLAFSHAGDNFAFCRDHVKRALGLPIGRLPPHIRPPQKAQWQQSADKSASTRTADALKLWREGIDPGGTPVEVYLASRRLELDKWAAGRVLRWHPRTSAMLALFRDIQTDEPKAISRVFLNFDGTRRDRMFLGPVRGCAVKLDPDEEVLSGLHVGEGIETVMASRQIGLRPAWALGSAGAIASFPVLAGVESLSLLREHDEANRRAADACALRWTEANREVLDVWPRFGKDVNDAIRGRS